MKKNAYYVAGMFLAFTMIASMMLTVTAQTNDVNATADLWQPPHNFVDPVTLRVQEYRTKGLSNEQITAELAKQGMGWYPKTGATWLGRTLTSEELAKIPNRAIDTPSSDVDSVASQVSRRATMRTSSYSWTGVSAEAICGSMSVASGQTQYHYLCVQLGDLNGATNWAEALVTHNYGETYKWYTYDRDEGGYTYYMDKNTASTAVDTYVIMLDGTQDADGWHYDVWINYQWVRRGHLTNLWVQAGFQKEVYSNGQFTNDASNAIFYRNWLHNAQGWSYWTNTVATTWSANTPARESHSMGAVSYNWQTWIQN
jgi:hypothetical protein